MPGPTCHQLRPVPLNDFKFCRWQIQRKLKLPHMRDLFEASKANVEMHRQRLGWIGHLGGRKLNQKSPRQTNSKPFRGSLTKPPVVFGPAVPYAPKISPADQFLNQAGRPSWLALVGSPGFSGLRLVSCR